LPLHSIQCVTGGKGMERAYSGVTHWFFDHILNLQNCFTIPNKPRRGVGLRHLPPRPFTGKFSRKKADI
jgi:hypothetical protein